MYTKEKICKLALAFRTPFIWFSETLFQVMFYMRIFYKQMRCCGACTHVMPAKLQVKAWQLVKSASPGAGSKKLVSVLPPEERWNCYHPDQGEEKPFYVSADQSLSATCPC